MVVSEKHLSKVRQIEITNSLEKNIFQYPEGTSAKIVCLIVVCWQFQIMPDMHGPLSFNVLS